MAKINSDQIKTIGELQKSSLSFSYLTDGEGIIISEGDGVRKLLGHSIGLHFEDIFKMVDPSAFNEIRLKPASSVKINTKQNDLPFRGEYQLLDSGGLILWVITPFFSAEHTDIYRNLVSCIPSHTLLGEVIFLKSSINSSVQESIKLIEQLQEAVKSKDEFLSIISHEIRNPLNIIVGNSELLKDEIENPEGIKMLGAVLNSSKHLKIIINDLLDFSKIVSGNIQLNRESVNLPQCIDETVEMYRTAALEKGIELNLVSSYPSHVNVHTDGVRLAQIISNLISNALKFTSTGSVEVKLNLVSSDTNSQRVFFSVSDTGIGINPENIQKILLPFQQEFSDTSRKYGGTGLGLSIVAKLLVQLGSQLNISSEQGRGSEFSFEINFSVSRHAFDDSHQKSGAELGKLKEISILYVDDMEPNQFLLKSMVSKWGVQIQTVSSVDEATEICNERNFDLILMDIQMPEKDGVEGFHLIRNESALNSQTPIVALTGNAESNDRLKYKRVGFLELIAKPVDQKALFRFLTDFISKYIK